MAPMLDHRAAGALIRRCAVEARHADTPGSRDCPGNGTRGVDSGGSAGRRGSFGRLWPAFTESSKFGTQCHTLVMVFDAGFAADSLERDLRAVATAERAANEKRYLKSDLEFLGATVGDIRRAVRALREGHGELNHGELIALVEALWRKPVHERRMAAIVLLESSERLLTINDLEMLERLIRGSRTWALVDVLAAKVAGAIVWRDEQAGGTLDRWSRDDDFWLRRSALLALMITVKKGGDLEKFGRFADAMLHEKEFFIRKAIGWVLREASKSHPDAVFAWLAPRTALVSGVTIREAVKYLGSDQRDVLMAAFRQRRPAEVEPSP